MVASKISLAMTDIGMFSRFAISLSFCSSLTRASLLAWRLLRKARPFSSVFSLESFLAAPLLIVHLDHQPLHLFLIIFASF